jgi:hypothetical protein
MRTDGGPTAVDGRPSTDTPTGSAVSKLTHVVFTRSTENRTRIYVDGVCQAEREVGGDFSTWDPDYGLLLGNELIGDRAWLGTFHWVAICDRALTETEVRRSFAAGLGR